MVEAWSQPVGPSLPLQTCYTLQVYSNGGHWLTVRAHADLAATSAHAESDGDDRAGFV